MSALQYAPDFAQEQAHWGPKYDQLFTNATRTLHIGHGNLTEGQAQAEAFAAADIMTAMSDMENNRAPRSEFFHTKFLYLRVLLGRSKVNKKEALSAAEQRYQQLENTYAGEGKDEIDELGKELKELRQKLDPAIAAPMLGYSGRGNHIDRTNDHPSEAKRLLDERDADAK